MVIGVVGAGSEPARTLSDYTNPVRTTGSVGVGNARPVQNPPPYNSFRHNQQKKGGFGTRPYNSICYGREPTTSKVARISSKAVTSASVISCVITITSIDVELCGLAESTTSVFWLSAQLVNRS